MLQNQSHPPGNSGWYLIARDGESAVRVVPGMHLGEDAQGDLSFAPADAWVSLVPLDDGRLDVRSVSGAFELDVEPGRSAERVAVDAQAGADIHLGRNVIVVDVDFAHPHPVRDRISIRVLSDAPLRLDADSDDQDVIRVAEAIAPSAPATTSYGLRIRMALLACLMVVCLLLAFVAQQGSAPAVRTTAEEGVGARVDGVPTLSLVDVSALLDDDALPGDATISFAIHSLSALSVAYPGDSRVLDGLEQLSLRLVSEANRHRDLGDIDAARRLLELASTTGAATDEVANAYAALETAASLARSVPGDEAEDVDVSADGDVADGTGATEPLGAGDPGDSPATSAAAPAAAAQMPEVPAEARPARTAVVMESPAESDSVDAPLNSSAVDRGASTREDTATGDESRLVEADLADDAGLVELGEGEAAEAVVDETTPEDAGLFPVNPLSSVDPVMPGLPLEEIVLDVEAAQPYAYHQNLRLADRARMEGRLTGAGDSAVERYRRALEVAPDSHRARQGMKLVGDELVLRARQLFEAEDPDAALAMLSVAAEIGVDGEAIAGLRRDALYAKRLRDAEAGRFERLHLMAELTAVNQDPPSYPRRAPRGAEGHVDLEMTVTTTGQVRDIVVLGDPPSYFERAAVQAVSQWIFEPVLENGRPIPVRTSVRVSFRG